MHILHINTTQQGGAALCAMRISRALSAQGVDSRMLFAEGRTMPEGIEGDIAQPDKSCWDKNILTRIGRRVLVHTPLYPMDKFRMDRELRRVNSQLEKPLYLHGPFSNYKDIAHHPLVEWADIIHLHWVPDFVDSFPVLSKIQDDNDTLVHVYSRYIRILSMVIFFVMILLAALARPYTLLLYSEKWEAATIFLQLFCFRYLLYHIHAINWNLLLVKGRSDIALKKEIINKTVKFTLLIVSIPFGVVSICLAQICGSVFDLFVNTYYAGKVCGIGFRKQTSDFVPYLLLSVVACLPAFGVTYLNIGNILTLVLGISSACLLYWGYLWLKKDESLLSLIELTPLKKV